MSVVNPAGSRALYKSVMYRKKGFVYLMWLCGMRALHITTHTQVERCVRDVSLISLSDVLTEHFFTSHPLACFCLPGSFTAVTHLSLHRPYCLMILETILLY